MATETNQPEGVPTYGLPLTRFKAAVEALVQLRDEGKVLFLFARNASLRLIGSIEDYRAAFASQTGDDTVTREQAEIAQAEIQSLTAVLLRSETSDEALGQLEGHQFGRVRTTKRPDDEPEKRLVFQQQTRPKLELVAKAVLTETAKNRIARLATATIACIEDIDYEVIQERADHSSEVKFSGPFLRLRLRYLDREHAGLNSSRQMRK